MEGNNENERGMTSSTEISQEETFSETSSSGLRGPFAIHPLQFLRSLAGCVEEDCSISIRTDDMQGGLIKPSKEYKGPDGPSYGDGTIFMMRRPGKGKDGTQVDLLVNHFPVKIVDQHTLIFHYHVRLKPPCYSKSVNRQFKSLLQEKILGGQFVAFDGFNNLYVDARTAVSHGELGKDRVLFHVSPRGDGDTYTMILAQLNALSVLGLLNFLKGDRPVEFPRAYLQALGVVLTDSASWVHYVANNFFYFDALTDTFLGLNEGCSSLGRSCSIQALPGFSESLRPSECGLTLSLNVSATAFHARKCVLHYLQGRGIDPAKLLSHVEMRTKAREMLAGLVVETTYGTAQEKYEIIGISQKPAAENRTLDRVRQRETDVVECFRTNFPSVRIDPNLPSLIVTRGRDSHCWIRTLALFLPMDVCLIAPAQKFSGDIPDDQKLLLKRVAGANAAERYHAILECAAHLTHLLHHEQHIGNKHIRPIDGFGLRVENKMISVRGRILEGPVMMNPDGPLQVWKSGTTLSAKEWGVIAFGDPDLISRRATSMVDRIVEVCRAMGIFCFREDKEPVNYFALDHSLLEQSAKLEKSLSSLKAGPDFNNVRFAFCVLDTSGQKVPDLGNLRRVCEAKFGWLTECCFTDLSENFNSEYLTRIALNANAKLGGTNTALRDGLGTLFGSVFEDKRVILFGAEVFRPTRSLRLQQQRFWDETRKSTDEETPRSESIGPFDVAAVAASMEWPYPGQYCARGCSRWRTGEVVVEEFSEMVEGLVRQHILRNPRAYPERAVFFRDGVSEADFPAMLNTEFRMVKRALENHCPNLKLTWIVVDKRHDTLFFRADGSPSGPRNISPGTVVDSHVVHPWQFDFYLASQGSTSADEGIAKATRYHVVVDENGFTADDIQKFVYYLCHTFASCRKSVGIVPPLMYARMAARHILSYYSLSRGEMPSPELKDTMYFLS